MLLKSNTMKRRKNKLELKKIKISRLENIKVIQGGNDTDGVQMTKQGPPRCPRGGATQE